MTIIMNKTVSVIILATAILAGLIVFMILSPKIPMVSPTPSPTLSVAPGPDMSNLIKVYEPKPGQMVKSPLIVSGEARGTWYFEASFPVKILDANGVELGVVPAQAQGEWMTTEFVPFKAVLYFKKPETATGTLVLEKDNPSGLAENSAEIRIPVSFDLANWPAGAACKPTGCSGQICSDEEVVTTCEYSPEYACYKTAKCERLPDGKCGWTPTEELVSCVSAAFQAEPSGPQ